MIKLAIGQTNSRQVEEERLSLLLDKTFQILDKTKHLLVKTTHHLQPQCSLHQHYHIIKKIKCMDKKSRSLNTKYT